MSKKNIAIIGASGGIGLALTRLFAEDINNTIYAFSRSAINVDMPSHIVKGYINYDQENSIKDAAEQCAKSSSLDLVIVATGILHDQAMMPEKSLQQLSVHNFQKNFLINTIGPALVAKYFLPKLPPHKRGVFAVLSARVGSIEDNRLGGWYAYRSSKSALNMFLKTASIEMVRRQPETIVIGLHPGTVATRLSEPFQQRVPKQQLFDSHYSAQKLITVINQITPDHSGKILAWDGSIIPF